MQFDVYLFDFDGTLVDSRESLVPVFRAGYSVVGREVSEEECSRWMHINLRQSLEDSGIPEEQYETVVKAIIASLDLPESLALIRLYGDTLRVVRELKARGKRLGIVSNNGSAHIRNALRVLNVEEDLFDCVVGSDMFQNGKPSAEPIELALEILGEKKSKAVVYVGDSLQDPECAENADVSGILVDRENVHPDYGGIRIPSLKELL